MSDENAKNNFENVYLFLGLDDFESDKKRIAQAFENLETVYGVKLDKLITKNAPIEVPPHIKENFADWGEEETRSFIADLANKASIYRLVLTDPKKLAVYDEQLRAQPSLLQAQGNAKTKSNDKVVGRQFAPDGEENALSAYYKHLEEQIISAQNFEIKDEGDPRKIQQLLNRFMVTYHKYSWDLKNKPQDVHADYAPKGQEIKDITAEASSQDAPVTDTSVNEQAESEYIEAEPAAEAADEQKRIGYTIDGESSRVDEPEAAFDDADGDVDVDADFAPEPPPQAKQPKSKVNNDFSHTARGLYTYPEGGRDAVADLAAPMLIKNTGMALGNANFRIMTCVEGRRFLNKECGFSLDGRLDVEGLAVAHPDKAPEHVAVFGKVDIKCNGGFLNGNIDGRMRSTKYSQQIQQNAEGQPVQVDVPEHKYSKGKVVIDAGDEDIVINGNITGNVEIRTTGKVKVIGHIDGKVKINAAAGVDVFGNVSGGASLSSAGAVDIRGRKSFRVSTAGNVSVRGNDVTESMIHQWRVDTARKHFSTLDGANGAADGAQQQQTSKQEAPHA
jgi:hypothetical protein